MYDNRTALLYYSILYDLERTLCYCPQVIEFMYFKLSPFFGEEFGFLVPRDFRRLSFYVMASDYLPLSRDVKIGKVAIHKDALVKVCYNSG